MQIVYTKHAIQRLLLRGISKKKVNLAIDDSDYKERGVSGATIYYRDFGKNYLKVITQITGNKIIIITLHWVDAKRVKFKKVIKM